MGSTNQNPASVDTEFDAMLEGVLAALHAYVEDRADGPPTPRMALAAYLLACGTKGLYDAGLGHVARRAFDTDFCYYPSDDHSPSPQRGAGRCPAGSFPARASDLPGSGFAP